MLVAAAVGDLDDAQPIATEPEAHGLGINGNRTGRENACRQIFFVEMNTHAPGIGRSAPSLNLGARSSLSRSDGEGDHAKHGGGASGAARPSTTLRVVPLPMLCMGRIHAPSSRLPRASPFWTGRTSR